MKYKHIFIITLIVILSGCKAKKESNKDEQVKEQPRTFNMVYVEGGEFTMGNDIFEYNPSHQVVINDFYMSDIEVTQWVYEQVMGENPVEEFNIGMNKPVYYVSWYSAIEFCNKLSARDGYVPCYEINGEDVKCDFSVNGYRLPTEAEWEYAARGGKLSRGFKYSGSDNLDDVTFWRGNYESSVLPTIALKLPNELEIYDMTGSVEEWCWDWFSDNVKKENIKINPCGYPFGDKKICCGDSVFSLSPSIFDLARRTKHNPSYKINPVGFRICRSKEEE